MGKRIDISGQRFGMLVVTEYSHTNSDYKACFKCKCDCGNTLITTGKSLRLGLTKTCGCTRKEMMSKSNTTHGDCRNGKTPEYNIWRSMKERCLNPNNKNYKTYGLIGITVCDEWKNSYESFLSDMGRKPFKNASIERIDNKKGYSKSNCKWASQKEQQNNKSTNRKLTHNNITESIEYWSNATGLKYGTIVMRLHRGWTIEKTLTNGSK